MGADEIQKCLDGEWETTSISLRAKYAAQSIPVLVSKHPEPEPAPSAIASNRQAVEENSDPSADFENQQRETFQLHTFLKDANPEMLEASVQQGVKVLDRLKAPLVEKLRNSPDAEQWIQQIGK